VSRQKSFTYPISFLVLYFSQILVFCFCGFVSRGLHFGIVASSFLKRAFLSSSHRGAPHSKHAFGQKTFPLSFNSKPSGGSVPLLVIVFSQNFFPLLLSLIDVQGFSLGPYLNCFLFKSTHANSSLSVPIGDTCVSCETTGPTRENKNAVSNFIPVYFFSMLARFFAVQLIELEMLHDGDAPVGISRRR